MKILQDLSLTELKRELETIVEKMPRYRAEQVYKWANDYASFDEMNNIPKELQIERMNYLFANDRDGSRKFENVHPSDPCLYEFTVVDLKETSTGIVPWGGDSDYTIHVTYDLLNNREESFYVTVRIFGTPTVQVYGQPRLVVGDSYIMISKKFDGNDDYAGGPYIFKQWEYEGERYIYPYPVSDTQIFGNGVPFEFVEELSVYDSQNDRDVIEFLEDRGVELPVFKYSISNIFAISQ